MTLPNLYQVNTISGSKNDRAKLLISCTFDTALPQNWLNLLAQRSSLPYDTLRVHTVWAYPDGNVGGQAAPLCQEVANEILLHMNGGVYIEEQTNVG